MHPGISAIMRAATGLLTPAGPRARLSVFYFHRVLERPDDLLCDEPDAKVFDRIVGWITAQFNVINPLEACERLSAGTLPARAAMITFDDGYKDNYTVALPILKRHCVSACFFVATAYADGSVMFNDRILEAIRRTRRVEIGFPEAGEGRLLLSDARTRRAAIDRVIAGIKRRGPAERDALVRALERRCDVESPVGVMMNSSEVRAIRDAGMVVGGHTRTHPILRVLDDAAARAEIEQGRDDLMSMTRERPLLFAYPNGKFGDDFGVREMTLVQDAGFAYAFTTHLGVATASSNRYALPRLEPWERTPLRFHLRRLLNVSGAA